MHKIRISAIILLCLIMTMFVSVSYAAAPLTMTAAEYQELVKRSYQNSIEMKNYHMIVDVAMSTVLLNKDIDMAVKAICDVQTKPMRLKNDMTVTMMFDSKVKKEEAIQYIEQVENQVVGYTYTNNQWVKQLVVLPRLDPLEGYDNYIKSIKSITPVEETAGSITVEVVVGSEIWEKYNELIMAVADKSVTTLMAGMFTGLGDVTYRMTIDKKTATISQIDIDLSEFVSKISNNIAEANQLSEPGKTALNEVLDNMKVSISAEFSQFDQVSDIVIPEEAMNARELTPIRM